MLTDLFCSHNPSSPPSTKALELLRASLTSPYPPGQPRASPLEFDLDVVESTPPTADQIETIMSYLPPSTSASSAFLSAHPAAPSAAEAHTTKALTELMTRNPNAMKWPVVVDWMGGRASIGDVNGVKDILDAIKRERGGYNNGSDSDTTEEPSKAKGEGDNAIKKKGWFV